MNRALLAAAALMVVPLAVPVPPSAAAGVAGPRRSDEPETGIAVTMEQISPAYLQPGEPITVTGEITNLDREAWRDVQVYLLSPEAPATTTEEVTSVADSPASSYAGDRITGNGFYQELGRLAPGATMAYELTIPFEQLGIDRNEHGVYTLGVQALADNPFGSRETAGRARSFIPLMPDNSPSVGVSTIWPFREDLVRRPNGDYENRDDLIESISDGGRLDTMLDLARASGDVPISLLVDPALLDALQRIVNDTTELPGAPASPSSPTESPSTTDDAATEGTALEAIQRQTEQQRRAQEFLDDFAAVAANHTVWAEGYGDPDLTTLAGDYDGSRMFRTITRASRSALSLLDASTSRAYLPDGALDVEALDALGPKITTFVSSDQVRRWEPKDGPVGIVRAGGSRSRAVVTHDALLDGGPAPGPTDTALQVRQRLLAETAILSLRADTDGRRSAPSLALLTDDDWDPGEDVTIANFFGAFDAPWIRPTNLNTELVDGPRRGARKLRVPAHAEDREEPPLPESLARSADRIRGRGVIMFAITREDRQLLNYYDQTAALTISQQWRPGPDVPQEFAEETIADLDRQIRGVSIAAPEFVTLSSSSGRFPLTITNDLAWPITVGVELKAEDGGLKIDQDELIEVDPQQSTTVNVQVNAEDVGVAEVSARLTTPQGRPFGEPVTFKMRSSVVGTVIWIALGAAGAVIVLAVGRRIRRSGRSGAEPGPTEPAASETG